MLLLVIFAALFVLTEQAYDQTASCLMKIHNDGTDIGTFSFSLLIAYLFYLTID